MPKSSLSRWALSVGCAVAATSQLAVVTPAVAQLDEIIVTAQKREQRALEVPVSLSAFFRGCTAARGHNGCAQLVPDRAVGQFSRISELRRRKYAYSRYR